MTSEMLATELVSEVNSPYLGLALKSVLSLADGSQAARLRNLAGERLLHVRLSDATVVRFGHPAR